RRPVRAAAQDDRRGAAARRDPRRRRAGGRESGVSLRGVAAVAAALAAVLVLWLWPRGPKDPEAQIRALVAACVAGVEARDLRPVSDALADGFRGPDGASK